MSSAIQQRASIEGERAVLGAAMADPDVIADLARIVASGDFYDRRHQEIWDTILRLHDDGKPTNRASVSHDLRSNGNLDRVGGAPYLGGLVDDADVSSALFFAQVVAEEAGARRVAAYHLSGLQDAQPGSGYGLGELIARAQNGLDDVSETRDSGELVTLTSAFEETLDEMELLERSGGGITGLPTGFLDLDDKTAGLHAGQMVTIAGRPGMGKSTLALDLVRSVSIKHGKPSAIFSLEMSRVELTMRLVSAECRIPLQNIRTGRMDKSEWERVSARMPDIMSAPVFIDDSANTTMRDIRTKAQRLKQRHGLNLVVIDYLQLMESGTRVESRQQEVSQFSRQCKLLAKELGVAVIVVAQLNRGSETRADKRPQMSDLRESGSIEQDSDVVILIYRDEIANPDSTRVGEADFIVAKQRSGPAPVTVTVAAQLNLSRFVDMQVEVPSY